MNNHLMKSRRVAAAVLPVAEAMERRVMMSVYTVNTLSDAVNSVAGLLTLRQAVTEADSHSGADTVAFSPTIFTAGSTHTITLAQGVLTVSDNTTVQGPGMGVLTINGNKSDRVFQIYSGTTVAISGLTITDGSVDASLG